MSIISIYKAKLENNIPIINIEKQTEETLIGAFKTTENKSYIVTQDNNNQLNFREFFQDYTVVEDEFGTPSIKTIIFSQITPIEMSKNILEATTEAIKKFEDKKNIYEPFGITFTNFLNFSKNSVNLNDNKVQGLDTKSYEFLSKLHNENPNTSIYQSIEKLKLELKIDKLNKFKVKALTKNK